MRSQAQALANSVQADGDPTLDDRVERLYRQVFSRAPDDNERQAAARFLMPNPEARFVDYCQALLGLNEFVFID